MMKVSTQRSAHIPAMRTAPTLLPEPLLPCSKVQLSDAQVAVAGIHGKLLAAGASQ